MNLSFIVVLNKLIIPILILIVIKWVFFRYEDYEISIPTNEQEEVMVVLHLFS